MVGLVTIIMPFKKVLPDNEWSIFFKK